MITFVNETGLKDPFLFFSFYPSDQNLYLRHLHEIVGSFLGYCILYQYCSGPILDAFISLFFRGSKRSRQLKKWELIKYSQKSKEKQLYLNFKIHVVTMVQCIISILLVIPTLNLKFGMNILTFQDDFVSMISAITIGYFLWDLYVCIRWYSLFQFEFLMHAICSLFVFISSLAPYYQNYVSKFLLFELSSPFVNLNWLFSTLIKEFECDIPMVLNALNGIALIIVFFLVRIVWGWSCIIIMGYNIVSKKVFLDPKFPAFIMFATFLINMALNTLNCIWLSKMVRIAMKMAGLGKNSSLKKD
ncbi:hypothetical protein QEN19_000809 [Hanseniaspora menglaensis]